MNLKTIKSTAVDLTGGLLLALFLFVFFNRDFITGIRAGYSIPEDWLNVNTIFLSIIFEAIPFILIGVFVSSMIQIFVSEEALQRVLPKNPWIALVPATLLAAVFPVCECAIIPVIRRLIKKGMPLHIGVIFIVAAPILNPIVVASTYFAFRLNLTVLYARIGLGFILSVLIGAVIYLIFKNKPQLRWSKEELIGTQLEANPITLKPMLRLGQALHHAADEFFETGKYLLIGAFIAALVQTYFNRNYLTHLAAHQTSSTLIMMVFAFFISLCSEADAFVAASFSSKFTVGSIIAFLVYGPMLDLKTTIMLFAYFKTRFVLTFIGVVTILVFTSVMILQKFVL